jgi:hypothetical protein
MSRLTYKSGWWLMAGAVFLGCAACTRANRVQGGGRNNLPPTAQIRPSDSEPAANPAPATGTPAGDAIPQQATPAEATQPPASTQSLSDPATTQGDALEVMLTELERMNQSGDSIADIP